MRDAAQGLRYREFLTVLLVIDGEDPFPDNWIYIHQPGVRVLRIQNFKSWSPWMVPKGETDASIGMEYFCFEGDELWNMADDDLVAMAAREIEKLHLAQANKVKFGFVERVHKAYPIYDELYGERVKTIRGWLETIGNLTQVGRNGLHRYNNSDHSMLTAMRAVDNILLGTHHDIWAVNAESVYHEEHQENEDPYRRPPDDAGHGAAARLGAMRRALALLMALVLLAAAPGAALAATTATTGAKSGGSGSGGRPPQSSGSNSGGVSPSRAPRRRLRGRPRCRSRPTGRPTRSRAASRRSRRHPTPTATTPTQVITSATDPDGRRQHAVERQRRWSSWSAPSSSWAGSPSSSGATPAAGRPRARATPAWASSGAESGSKAPPKPRKLSPAERKRRKRGKAR